MECLKCKYELLLSDVLSNWDSVYDGDYSYTRGYAGQYKNWERELSNGATVQVWDKHSTESWGPKYYDGEYAQGSEFEAWIVLQIVEADGTELFFRKLGTANSYGQVSWDKPLQQVKATEKTVQVFENMYEAV